MHPVAIDLTGSMVKYLAGALLAGGLVAAAGGAVMHLRKETARRDKLGNYALFGIIGGAVLTYFSGGRVALGAFKDRWEPLPIYSYGVMLGVSLVVGWYVTLHYGRKDGLPRDKMAACYFWTAVAAIVGSRLLYVLTNPEEFTDPSKVFALREGGLVAYGGFLGGLVGSWVFARIKKMSLLSWADAAVPSLATGLLFTRVGCLLYGCDYGRPIGRHAGSFARAIAIRFPRWEEGNGAPAWSHHVLSSSEGGYGLDAGAAWSLPVYPTQILESALGAVLFVALVLAWRRRKFSGQIFLTFAILYAVGRYFLETLRDDPERGTVGFFSTSQFIGLATGALALFFYLRLAKQARENPDGAIIRHAEEAEPAAEPASAPGRRRRRKRGHSPGR
jgi:phosphatidylglycerol:prolipoprotein diacylglycerol transferase